MAFLLVLLQTNLKREPLKFCQTNGRAFLPACSQSQVALRTSTEPEPGTTNGSGEVSSTPFGCVLGRTEQPTRTPDSFGVSWNACCILAGFEGN